MALKHEELTERIIGAAIEVHRGLGPGLLESAYQRCLVHEMRLRGLDVAAEVSVDLEYKGLRVPDGYRLDILVENAVIVEVKAVETVLPIHRAQLLTYLRLRPAPVGLLLNFHNQALRTGIERFVL